jgi:hypothetical protein
MKLERLPHEWNVEKSEWRGWDAITLCPFGGKIAYGLKLTPHSLYYLYFLV